MLATARPLVKAYYTPTRLLTRALNIGYGFAPPSSLYNHAVGYLDYNVLLRVCVSSLFSYSRQDALKNRVFFGHKSIIKYGIRRHFQEFRSETGSDGEGVLIGLDRCEAYALNIAIV